MTAWKIKTIVSVVLTLEGAINANKGISMEIILTIMPHSINANHANKSTQIHVLLVIVMDVCNVIPQSNNCHYLMEVVTTAKAYIQAVLHAQALEH